MPGERPEDPQNSVLLGIKYEAARLGGVGDDALSNIESQARSEVGEGWEDDPAFLRGRNAVRGEHGLGRLGEPEGEPVPRERPGRPFWRRLLGG
jgi:hypothetical protein